MDQYHPQHSPLAHAVGDAPKYTAGAVIAVALLRMC